MLAVAFGFASTILALLADPIIGSQPSASYHWSGSASALFGPVILFVSLLWLLLSLIQLSARQPGRWRIAVWFGLLLPAPWVVFRIAVLHWGARLPSRVRMPRIAAAAAVWALIVLFWRPIQSKRLIICWLRALLSESQRIIPALRVPSFMVASQAPQ